MSAIWDINALMIKVKGSEMPLDHLTGLSCNFPEAMDMYAHFSCVSVGGILAESLENPSACLERCHNCSAAVSLLLPPAT